MLDADVVQTVIATEWRLAVDYVEGSTPLAWCVADDDLDIPPFLRRTDNLTVVTSRLASS